MTESTESKIALGMRAARARQFEFARQTFEQATQEAPDNELAWMWLAQLTAESDAKQAALNHVAALCPENAWAQHQLSVLSGQAEAGSNPFVPETQTRVEALQCPQCGGGVELQIERAQTVVCKYCKHVLDLSSDQIQAVGKRRTSNSMMMPIELGSELTMDSQTFLVVGWLRLKGRDSEEVWYWEEWLCVDQKSGTVRWLSYDPEEGFSWCEPVSIETGFDPGEARVIPTPDGDARIHDSGHARISALNGELTWRAKIGEPFYYIEARAEGARYSVEYTPNEIELFRCRQLTASEVWAAFGRDDLLAAAEKDAERREAASGFARIFGGFALLGLVGFVCSFFTGTSMLEKSVKLQRANAPEALMVRFDKTGAPHRLSIRCQRFPANHWAVVQVSARDANGKEHYLGGAEFWHETGRDSEGTWDESDYRGACTFVPAEAGDYTLLVELESSGPSPLTVKLEIQRGVWLKRYFVIFTLLCLGVWICAIMVAENRNQGGNA